MNRSEKAKQRKIVRKFIPLDIEEFDGLDLQGIINLLRSKEHIFGDKIFKVEWSDTYEVNYEEATQSLGVWEERLENDKEYNTRQIKNFKKRNGGLPF